MFAHDDFLGNHYSSWPGVWATAVGGFQIRDCDIHGWHDQVILEAAVGVSTRATIDGCTLKDAWPIADDPTTPLVDETNFGHAALWIAGAGQLACNIVDTTFYNCHDGIEFAAAATGGAGTATITGCRFELTENGVEVGQSAAGTATFTVDSTDFLRNYNRPAVGGTDWPPPDGMGASTGAILARFATETHAKIRNCEFLNNAIGIQTSGNIASTFDLGKSSADPGMNNFCMDFALFSLQAPFDDPYRVAVHHRLPGVLDAVGNWWVRNNQDADSSGIMLISSSPAGPQNDPPPGPLDGEFQSPGVKYKRNYAIQVTGATIQFSPPPTGAAPDCSEPP